MSMEEDIERLRNDVAGLYEENKSMRERLTKLEEKGCSWDDKIDELKTSMKELAASVTAQLTTLSGQINTLINAPAQKLAARWEDIVKQVLEYVVIAFVAYIIAKGGLK
jgi:outer membrane murein-binding lipoprotein Lpp